MWEIGKEKGELMANTMELRAFIATSLKEIIQAVIELNSLNLPPIIYDVPFYYYFIFVVMILVVLVVEYRRRKQNKRKKETS